MDGLVRRQLAPAIASDVANLALLLEPLQGVEQTGFGEAAFRRGALVLQGLKNLAGMNGLATVGAKIRLDRGGDGAPGSAAFGAARRATRWPTRWTAGRASGRASGTTPGRAGAAENGIEGSDGCVELASLGLQLAQLRLCLFSLGDQSVARGLDRGGHQRYSFEEEILLLRWHAESIPDRWLWCQLSHTPIVRIGHEFAGARTWLGDSQANADQH